MSNLYEILKSTNLKNLELAFIDGLSEIHAIVKKVILRAFWIYNLLKELTYLESVKTFCSEVLEKFDLGNFSAEQEGIKLNPIELSQFIDFIKRNKLQMESFIIGTSQCKFCCTSRCVA